MVIIKYEYKEEFLFLEGLLMTKLYYVGPRVEITNQGIFYKKSKEDKYVYLMTALEILRDIDNDYEKQPSYIRHFQSGTLEEEKLHSVLQEHESDIEERIAEENDRYKQKIKHKIAYIKTLPQLTDTDKEVWINNIEIMKEYRMQRAINKMYYMHCIQDIVHLIQHKKIKEITTPFNKIFFHVLNTIKGALITGKPSLDAKVIEEYDNNDNMILKLLVR